MKILLTGPKQIGKSTCIKECIELCQMEVCGFQTLPIYEKEERKGFYFHSILAIEGNDPLFSVDKDGGQEVIPGVFDSFGTRVLKQMHHYPDRVWIMDEIGRLEQNEQQYLACLKACIHDAKHLLGVMKQCSLPYLEEIKQMPDVTVLDFQEMSYESIKEFIIKTWREQQ